MLKSIINLKLVVSGQMHCAFVVCNSETNRFVNDVLLEDELFSKYSETSVESCKFSYPTCNWHPFGVNPLEFCRDFWLQKIRIPGLLWGEGCFMTSLAVFIQHDRPAVSETQTQNHRMHCASFSSSPDGRLWQQ